MAIKAVDAFLDHKRVLYAAPTIEQLDRFWFEVCRSLQEPINAGVLKKNESEHFIEVPGTENRIKAKTAWNANTLRGDYADWLILDEFQLMAEDTWAEVGAPMLLDKDGYAVFIYTPPSLSSSGVSRARDPRHATRMFKAAQQDTSGRWATFHFTSYDNPTISNEALAEVTKDMSLDSYRREIMAMDDDIEQSWLVYGAFNETVCKIQRFPIPKDWVIYSGHDFGSANPGALFIAQNPGPGEPMTSTFNQVRKGDYVIFKEYCPGRGHSTFEHIENFKGLTQGYKVTRSVGGNQTGEDEIRQGYGAQGWYIVPPKFAKVNPQIDRVVGLMELNKVHIFEDLHNVLFQIANCLWILDDENKPTNKVQDDARWHLLAALRYIGSDFTPETIIRQTPRSSKGIQLTPMPMARIRR